MDGRLRVPSHWIMFCCTFDHFTSTDGLLHAWHFFKTSILVCFYSPEPEVQLLMCLWFWWRDLYCWTWNQITHRQNIFMSLPNLYKHIPKFKLFSSAAHHQWWPSKCKLQSLGNSEFWVRMTSFLRELLKCLCSLCMSGARLVFWVKLMTCIK